MYNRASFQNVELFLGDDPVQTLRFEDEVLVTGSLGGVVQTWQMHLY